MQYQALSSRFFRVCLFLVVGILLFGAAATTRAQLAVDDSLTPTELVNILLGPNSGITISNVNLIGHPDCAGSFAGGAGILGLEDGIVLGSGRVVDVVGPNALDDTTGTFGTPGDALPGQPRARAPLIHIRRVRLGVHLRVHRRVSRRVRLVRVRVHFGGVQRIHQQPVHECLRFPAKRFQYRPPTGRHNAGANQHGQRGGTREARSLPTSARTDSMMTRTASKTVMIRIVRRPATTLSARTTPTRSSSSTTIARIPTAGPPAPSTSRRMV